MVSTSDANGVGCSLQPRITNSSKQIFYFSIDYYTNTYYLKPNTSSSNRVLSLTGSSDINNNNIVLKTNTSDSTQKWVIIRSQYGYCLRASSGNKYMAPNSLGTTAGTRIGTEEYFEIVMNYLEENPGETIEEALNFADEEFSCNQCTETNCPANPTNRTTMGQKNISINMN